MIKIITASYILIVKKQFVTGHDYSIVQRADVLP